MAARTAVRPTLFFAQRQSGGAAAGVVRLDADAFDELEEVLDHRRDVYVFLIDIYHVNELLRRETALAHG